MIKSWLFNKNVNKLQLNKIKFEMVGAKLCKLHYRKLQREKILALANNKKNFESSMQINLGTQDILWWLLENIHEHFSFSYIKPSLTMYSDASNRSWGSRGL